MQFLEWQVSVLEWNYKFRKSIKVIEKDRENCRRKHAFALLLNCWTVNIVLFEWMAVMKRLFHIQIWDSSKKYAAVQVCVCVRARQQFECLCFFPPLVKR